MKVHKDNQHCVTLHPFSWRGKRYLMVCVGLYAGLDPEGGVSRVRTEQEFWKEVPGVFAALWKQAAATISASVKDKRSAGNVH